MKPASGARILVVEDEALIAVELRQRLKRLGHEVVGVAESALEAQKLAWQERPDLVLMDVRLKGEMDGIEAAAEIQRTLALPVIFLTAHSDPTILRRVQEAAPQAYLLKPLRERELEVAIELALHRQRSERRLRESQVRYAATLDSLGEGIVTTDLEGRITFMNPVAQALTGWTMTEAEGTRVDEVFALAGEDDRQPMPTPVEAVIREGKDAALERPALLFTRTHEAMPVEACAAPLRIGEGPVIGAVLVFRDIRQRRLSEESTRRAEGERRQARDLEALGRLAGGVAHDFNSLLTVIGGYSELLLDDEGLDAGAAGLVREIQKAAQRASALTYQLLAFGRRQLLVPVLLDLNQVVSRSLELVGRLVGAGVEVKAELRASPAALRADPAQLEQVLAHLATNARDAMPEGGTLTLETGRLEAGGEGLAERPEMKPGPYLVLAIRDTGSGMDDAVLAHLFEPFRTTKDRASVSGLGLATVYGIVKQSGGHVEAESAPGKGSTFRIYLPAEPEEPAAGS